MSQTHVAGGPLGVARVDRPRRAPRSRHPQTLIRAVLAALGLVIRVLAATAIVAAVAIASFGLVLGILIAGLMALIIVPTVIALTRQEKRSR
jgi:hypothetical protein